MRGWKAAHGFSWYAAHGYQFKNVLLLDSDLPRLIRQSSLREICHEAHELDAIAIYLRRYETNRTLLS